ncbi:hypothetical protein WR25_19647 [Diploscapter pachys]|uniref:Skp1-related protein n=1 Tax=Diploscapter pachys TaxID=2018661 RepID=A0A2A2LTN0_9BILA|nr:hypothetical protein WR25_19647 [Diploscapter pachys]
MHNSSIVKLQSNDGQVFEVAYGTIKQSQTMEALLEEFDYPEDVIPIPNINSATLAKIVEWCEHHKNDPAYVEEEVDPLRRHTSIEVPEWDRNFFNVSQEMLSDILNVKVSRLFFRTLNNNYGRLCE